MPDLLQQQIDYYRARAGEYDEWFLRRGRYDRGPAANKAWFDEVAILRQAVAEFRPRGRVLELACGTGLWTEQLVPHADKITAVDAVAEAIELNRARVASDRVCYELADLFSWAPPEQFDVIFFAFWLSHVPPDRFAEFWNLIAKALRPGGRAFLIDSRYTQISTAKDHELPPQNDWVMTRRLNDGREFQIVKVFYEPDSLRAALRPLGWQANLRITRSFFIYGSATRTE